MVLVHTFILFLYFTAEAAFNNGLNPHVMDLSTFHWWFSGKSQAKLTLVLLCRDIWLSSFWVGYRVLEHLDIRNPRGLAKILGTLFSLVGVMIMTSCKGPVIRNLSSPLIHISRNNLHENWTKGAILTVASCITWSVWYIMQAFTMKKYPAPLSITAWMNFIGGAQSAVIAVIMQHKPEAWSCKVNIQLWSTIYAGVVSSGIIIFVLLWCTKQKGPVFVTMFNPLSTIMVAFTAYFVLGEKLYTGSILGAVIAIIGLYLLLWGKEIDQQVGVKSQEQSNLTSEEQKEPTQIATSP
ncbi:hypothetical protein PVL29_008896 [Vitis rotundifolia]|uniref:WAT1-related protein n=1 Tax=Vitis rotundifolia TaxID=103349 RepID=A0AA38ZY05_VITRO|nr:hypothetical protein PVL29_008896 [Vitis rotundifolia]